MKFDRIINFDIFLPRARPYWEFFHHLHTYLKKTRIVRGSDYSPASELFARVRKTMAGNNPKLDLINTDAYKKIGQILSICSQGIVRKQNSKSIKGQNSVKS